ncbi:MAG: hypothetical protein IJ412_03115 [Oscillospiraceae bacterium]|nr:hypothetical protein [Oscillospiraceae bacterium]
MTELAETIAKAVHAVDDDVISGLMIAGEGYNTFDLPEYRDSARAGLSGVETCAEMVIYPYVERGKSDRINARETALHIGPDGSWRPIGEGSSIVVENIIPFYRGCCASETACIRKRAENGQKRQNPLTNFHFSCNVLAL